jgi:hypothetical protein
LTGRGKNIPEFERGVPTEELQVVDKKKGALSHNDIAQQLETLDKLALIDEEIKTISSSNGRTSKCSSLSWTSTKSGTSVTFYPTFKYSRGDGKPDITFDTSRLRGRMDEIAYLNAGLVLTLKDELPQVQPEAICKSIITLADFSKYVDLLCRSKTPVVWWWLEEPVPKKEERQ